MWESIRVKEAMWLSWGEPHVSGVYNQTRRTTHHGISLFHVLFVEDILARVSLWRPFSVGFRGGNLLVGQHLPELGGSINGHVLAQRK